jgi:CRISPR/Cas system-associated endoribonuclease Cas2
MQKKHDAQHKRLTELLDWSKAKLNKIHNRWNPRGVRSEDPEAIRKLKEELAKRERTQEIYKATNKIVRRKKGTIEEKLEELKEKGLPATRKLFEKDFAGRTGYPAYLLKNNNAEIRRLKERIEQLQREQKRDLIQFTVEDREEGEVEIEDDPDDRRVRLIFGDRVSSERYRQLKANGFKHARSLGSVFQRLANDSARSAVLRVLDLDEADQARVRTWITGEEPEPAPEPDYEIDIDPNEVMEAVWEAVTSTWTGKFLKWALANETMIKALIIDKVEEAIGAKRK